MGSLLSSTEDDLLLKASELEGIELQLKEELYARASAKDALQICEEQPATLFGNQSIQMARDCRPSTTDRRGWCRHCLHRSSSIKEFYGQSNCARRNHKLRQSLQGKVETLAPFLRPSPMLVPPLATKELTGAVS
ncbi:hypothetical protein Drorol1_Dr00018024 [Drosera rotundifolia]